MTDDDSQMSEDRSQRADKRNPFVDLDPQSLLPDLCFLSSVICLLLIVT